VTIPEVREYVVEREPDLLRFETLEEIENKYFDNVDTAKLYVEELNLIK
jgi:hypothetical protein